MQLSIFGQLVGVALWAMRAWGNPVEKAGAKALSSLLAFWLDPSLETQKALLADAQKFLAADIISMPLSPPPATPSDPPPSVIMDKGGHYIPSGE